MTTLTRSSIRQYLIAGALALAAGAAWSLDVHYLTVPLAAPCALLAFVLALRATPHR